MTQNKTSVECGDYGEILRMMEECESLVGLVKGSDAWNIVKSALTRCRKWDEAGMVVVPRELSVKENAQFYMLMESVGISTFCEADLFWQKLLEAAAPITSAGE